MKLINSLVLMLAFSLVACSSQVDLALTESPTQTTVAESIPANPQVGISTPAVTSTEKPQPVPASTSTLTPTPEVKTEQVTFTTQDDIILGGTMFGEGDFVVILTHMGMPGTTQSSWHPFARSLAERGFRVLTLDFRGRGQSGGKPEINTLPFDMDAAIQYLNDLGYTHLACIGASMGGTACMRAALDHDLVGLGVLASILSNGKPNEVSLDEIQQLNLPKIFIYGAYDFPTVITDMKSMSAAAPEPKTVQVYPTFEHGTDIFDTEYGNQLSELLISFLEAVRSGSPLPSP
jgi:dienelactone hydrolase